MVNNEATTVRPPIARKLRAYAFDPSLSLEIDTAEINSMTYKVNWEELQPGPSGEYVEVIDFDPTIKKFFTPINLNDPYLLAQDGLDPSESNPQFHQQMVYAVVMTTIKNFEKALGRRILWAPRLLADSEQYEEYVPKLRIYPHALREANAYYSPQKKALLFGYFSSAPAEDTMMMPNSLVFTCLSHDIIAHETTHAILDGMHYYYNEPTNPDVLAFHEAFADIVALFQHFTFPEVLKQQIAQTRGDLASQNLLGKLAQEFGAAIGNYGSLRDAIGEIVNGEWQPKKPNADDYRTQFEPHERGSILVAAVFEAFINIYKRRVADLLRIATNGSGILAPGNLHPDLVNRLAKEAAKAASHVLNMCIRALDYCPPVDITFGEYLRAIITADIDLVTDDSRDYRLAFIDAFRRRGIYPTGIKTLSEASLSYVCEPKVNPEVEDIVNGITNFLRDYREHVIYVRERKAIYEKSRDFLGGNEKKGIKGLHQHIFFRFEQNYLEFEKLTGLVFNAEWPKFGVRTTGKYGEKIEGPSFRVQNLRMVSRTGPGDNQINYIVFSLIQRAGVVVKDDKVETYVPGDGEPPKGGFDFYGGCTMIFDLDRLKLKYAISKPLLSPDKLQLNSEAIDTRRVLKQHAYQTDEGLLSLSEQSLYFGMGLKNYFNEPFAFLHRH